MGLSDKLWSPEDTARGARFSWDAIRAVQLIREGARRVLPEIRPPDGTLRKNMEAADAIRLSAVALASLAEDSP